MYSYSPLLKNYFLFFVVFVSYDYVRTDVLVIVIVKIVLMGLKYYF